jgi:GDP-L-fucose synthase
MEERMKRVLITGGSGFLGRHIVEKAKSKGYKVYAPRSKEFNLVTMDGVESYLERLKADGPLDVVVHSAAYYGGIGINQSEPATIYYRNTQMSVNVFEIARKYNVKKVLPIGSACAYPGYVEGDLKENDFWNGKLHDSVEAYGFSKKIQLVAEKAYYKQYGIESNHLILTNLYGPNDVFTEYRSHVVSALIKKYSDADSEVTLWGDGTPIREFLYVEDAAEAIVRAIALPHDLEPINIGTGIGTTIKELAEIVSKYTGFSGNTEWDTTKPNGAPRKVLDISRMKEKLGWQPVYTLSDGLRHTIDWYLANKKEADERE